MAAEIKSKFKKRKKVRCYIVKFEVGDIVEVLRDHAEGSYFVKGDRFVIENINSFGSASVTKRAKEILTM